MPIGTQKAPSARAVGDFRQLLVCLHVSHLPMLCILVLTVQRFLHTQPSGVTVVSGGLSFDAYRHSEGTQLEPSAQTVGGFRESLAFLQVSHLALHAGVQFFCTHGPQVCLGCRKNSAPMPTSTQKAEGEGQAQAAKSAPDAKHQKPQF